MPTAPIAEFVFRNVPMTPHSVRFAKYAGGAAPQFVLLNVSKAPHSRFVLRNVPMAPHPSWFCEPQQQITTPQQGALEV
jgi:hypothetical protein